MKQVIVDAIEALVVRGEITRRSIFEAAKDTTSPLHRLFVWDGDDAIEELGLLRAGELLRDFSFTIIRRGITFSVPQYIEDCDKPRLMQGYADIHSIAKNPGKAKRTIDAEIAAIAALVARGRAVAAGLDLQSEFETRLAAAIAIHGAPLPQPPRRHGKHDGAGAAA